MSLLNGDLQHCSSVVGFYWKEGVRLGHGHFSQVELATHLLLDTRVALKVVDTSRIRPRHLKENYIKEGRVHLALRHPRIIALFEAFWQGDLYCLVLEYLPDGDLRKYLNSQPSKRITECAARHIMQDLVSALIYLHGKGIIHRNISLRNIMLDRDKQAKLIDFGLCTFSDSSRKDFSQKRNYELEFSAPELICSEHYNSSVDLWSLGIVLYAMVLGKLPFQLNPAPNDSDSIKNHRFYLLAAHGLSPGHKEQLDVLTPRCKQLIEQLLEPRPSHRISLHSLKHHFWIACNFTGWNERIKKLCPTRDNHKLFAIKRISDIVGISVGEVLTYLTSSQQDHIMTMYKLLLTGLGDSTLHGSLSDLSFLSPSGKPELSVEDWHHILKLKEAKINVNYQNLILTKVIKQFANLAKRQNPKYQEIKVESNCSEPDSDNDIEDNKNVLITESGEVNLKWVESFTCSEDECITNFYGVVTNNDPAGIVWSRDKLVEKHSAYKNVKITKIKVVSKSRFEKSNCCQAEGDFSVAENGIKDDDSISSEGKSITCRKKSSKSNNLACYSDELLDYFMKENLATEDQPQSYAVNTFSAPKINQDLSKSNYSEVISKQSSESSTPNLSSEDSSNGKEIMSTPLTKCRPGSKCPSSFSIEPSGSLLVESNFVRLNSAPPKLSSQFPHKNNTDTSIEKLSTNLQIQIYVPENDLKYERLPFPQQWQGDIQNSSHDPTMILTSPRPTEFQTNYGKYLQRRCKTARNYSKKSSYIFPTNVKPYESLPTIKKYPKYLEKCYEELEKFNPKQSYKFVNNELSKSTRLLKRKKIISSKSFCKNPSSLPILSHSQTPKKKYSGDGSRSAVKKSIPISKFQKLPTFT